MNDPKDGENDILIDLALTLNMTNEPKVACAQLRLYVARSTSNSLRAEQNLMDALKTIDGQNYSFELEIVDVFAAPQQAVMDRIVVTPTLIGIGANKRATLVGNLMDSAKLEHFLISLFAAAAD